MMEVTQTPLKSVNLRTIVRDTLQGCIDVDLLQPRDEIVSVYLRSFDHGYPIPSLERDGILEKALPSLKEKGIYSRGRFGSWKYEVGNQGSCRSPDIITILSPFDPPFIRSSMIICLFCLRVSLCE